MSKSGLNVDPNSVFLLLETNISKQVSKSNQSHMFAIDRKNLVREVGFLSSSIARAQPED